MKKIFFVFFILFSFSIIPSMSWALPDCPTNQNNYRHNCFGRYVWNNGDKYVGEYQNNKKHGQGNQSWENGDKYVGEYKNNKRTGQGTYIYGENTKFAGDRYIGEFKDAKKHGQGTYIFTNGDKFVGEFKDEKYAGNGTYFYANGAKDVGEWKNGKLNGYAIQYNADGTILKEGIFKDDVFQYAQKKPSNSSNSNSKLNKYKEFCEEIGYKPGTEKFADCVLKTMEKD